MNINENNLLDAITDSLRKQPEILAKEFAKLQTASEKKLIADLENSKNNDKKLLRIIEESISAEGTYKKAIDKLLKDYVSEKNYQGDQLEEVTKLLQKANHIQELSNLKEEENRKREQRTNPLLAFKHAFEDLKANKGVKSSAKTLGSGILEGLNLKTVSKGLLHGAGLITQNPAFNILADKISTSVKAQEEQNQKQYEFLKELEELSDDTSKAEETSKKSLDEFNNIVKSVQEKLSSGLTPENASPIFDKLNSIENNTEATYEDLGSELENIRKELTGQTKIFKEQLFMQKDAQAESKDYTFGTSNVAKSTFAKKDEEKEDNDYGLLGGAIDDIFGSDKKNKKGGSRLKNAGKSISAVATGIARLAGPIALATGAIFSVYGGIQGYKKAAENFDLKGDEVATASQKITSTISGAIDTLTFGLFDEKAIAQKIDEAGSAITKNIKRVLGIYDKSDALTDALESKNIIDKSTIGFSEVRDWAALEDLSENQLQALLDYGDWSTKTQSKILAILRKKRGELNVDGSTMAMPQSNYVPPTMTSTQVSSLQELGKKAQAEGVSSMSKEDRDAWYANNGYNTSTGKFNDTKIGSTPNVTTEKLPEPKPTVVQAPPVTVQAPPPVVVNNKTEERKIDSLNLTDKDSSTLVATLGVGR